MGEDWDELEEIADNWTQSNHGKSARVSRAAKKNMTKRKVGQKGWVRQLNGTKGWISRKKREQTDGNDGSSS